MGDVFDQIRNPGPLQNAGEGIVSALLGGGRSYQDGFNKQALAGATLDEKIAQAQMATMKRNSQQQYKDNLIATGSTPIMAALQSDAMIGGNANLEQAQHVGLIDEAHRATLADPATYNPVNAALIPAEGKPVVNTKVEGGQILRSLFGDNPTIAPTDLNAAQIATQHATARQHDAGARMADAHAGVFRAQEGAGGFANGNPQAGSADVQAGYDTIASQFGAQKTSGVRSQATQNGLLAQGRGVANSQHLAANGGTAADYVVPPERKAAFIAAQRAAGNEVVDETNSAHPHVHVEKPPGWHFAKAGAKGKAPAFTNADAGAMLRALDTPNGTDGVGKLDDSEVKPFRDWRMAQLEHDPRFNNGSYALTRWEQTRAHAPRPAPTVEETQALLDDPTAHEAAYVKAHGVAAYNAAMGKKAPTLQPVHPVVLALNGQRPQNPNPHGNNTNPLKAQPVQATTAPHGMPPVGAIAFLKANPGAAAAFESKYGVPAAQFLR